MSVNLINKKNAVNKVSNPDIVLHNAVKYLGHFDNFDFDFSTRRNKKYMIRGHFTNDKWVHFGDINYQDYTITKNIEKRNKFLKRNHHWITKYPEYSPAWFAYYLLW
jgi:hypothetical protein